MTSHTYICRPWAIGKYLATYLWKVTVFTGPSCVTMVNECLRSVGWTLRTDAEVSKAKDEKIKRMHIKQVHPSHWLDIIVADRWRSSMHWPVAFNQWDLGNSCGMLLLSSSAAFSQNRLDPIIQSVKCERSKWGIVDLARMGLTFPNYSSR